MLFFDILHRELRVQHLVHSNLANKISRTIIGVWKSLEKSVTCIQLDTINTIKHRKTFRIQQTNKFSINYLIF